MASASPRQSTTDGESGSLGSSLFWVPGRATFTHSFATMNVSHTKETENELLVIHATIITHLPWQRFNASRDHLRYHLQRDQSDHYPEKSRLRRSLRSDRNVWR